MFLDHREPALGWERPSMVIPVWWENALCWGHSSVVLHESALCWQLPPALLHGRREPALYWELLPVLKELALCSELLSPCFRDPTGTSAALVVLVVVAVSTRRRRHFSGSFSNQRRSGRAVTCRWAGGDGARAHAQAASTAPSPPHSPPAVCGRAGRRAGRVTMSVVPGEDMRRFHRVGAVFGEGSRHVSLK